MADQDHVPFVKSPSPISPRAPSGVVFESEIVGWLRQYQQVSDGLWAHPRAPPANLQPARVSPPPRTRSQSVRNLHLGRQKVPHVATTRAFFGFACPDQSTWSPPFLRSSLGQRRFLDEAFFRDVAGPKRWVGHFRILAPEPYGGLYRAGFPPCRVSMFEPMLGLLFAGARSARTMPNAVPALPRGSRKKPLDDLSFSVAIIKKKTPSENTLCRLFFCFFLFGFFFFFSRSIHEPFSCCPGFLFPRLSSPLPSLRIAVPACFWH